MKITKKLLAVLLSALILVASMPMMAVAAEELVSADGFKYEIADGKATVTGYTGTATDVVIPAELDGTPVVKIGSRAFQGNTAITSVIFPDTVESIAYEAFKGCTALKDVELPKSLTTLDGGAFGSTAIESIEIPKSLDKANTYYSTYRYTLNGVEYSFYGGPFVLCDSLKTVTFEKGTTQIAESLFRGCTGLEEITIPDTVTVIETSAFEECLNLKSIDIPDCVTKIDGNAFNTCASLKEVTLGGGLTTLGGAAFGSTPIESIEIPKSLDKATTYYSSYEYTLNGVEYSFYAGPFVLCDNLKTVTFGKGTNQIAENLFRGCTGIEEITIPDTVTTIEYGAFEECLNLKSINIPDYVTKIESHAFANCASLKDVELSKGLTSIGYSAFESTPIESIEIPKSLDKADYSYSSHEYTINDVKYSVSSGPFVLCDNLKTVTFEDGTTQIAEYLFRGCTGLEKIVIPEGVTVIETGAFKEAVKLKEITIPATVTEIQSNAFETAASLESMVLAENIEKIGYLAFKNCDSLTSFEVKNADATLGDGALADNDALTDVQLPANLVEISNELFSGSTALKTIEIPESVEYIRRDAFKKCTALESISIPQGVDTLGSGAFYGCENLTEVIFPDYSVKEILADTFAECYSLKAITLPKGIEVIEGNAFVNCIELTDVVIPESATEIANNAFSYPGKTTIYSQTGSYVEEYANNGGFTFVDNVTEIETIKLKDGVTKLILEEDETYKLEFELDPVDANEVIKLTSSDDLVVSVDGNEIKTSFWNETVEITAETLSGAKLTFEVYVRGIDYIRAVDGTYQDTYAIGDEFNMEGMKVNAHYSDDTVVEIEGFTLESFNSSESGYTQAVILWVDSNGDEHRDYLSVEILGEGEEPPTLKVQKDENTQIIVEAITNAELAVVEITESVSINEVNLALVGEKVAKLYDITLVEDGEAIQPDGTVTVKIPAADETSKVYRVEEDGTLTDMGAVYEDGFMVFTTEHFSLYVVTVEVEESEFEIGDVNMDGKVNIKDATAIQKHAAKIAEFDETALVLADFDANGKVNVRDATAIQKKIAGLI